MPNAINLMTCDPGMLERTFFQGAMRARQLLFGQDLEYVIHKGAKDSFINEAARVKDILLTCIKNQAIRKSKDLYKAYLQKLDYALKDYALKQLLGSDRYGRASAYKKYEKILVDTMEDSPYKQFGTLNAEISPIDALKKYSKVCARRCGSANELVAALEQIIKDAEQNKELMPQKVAGNSSIGSQEAEQEVETQVEVHQEHVVEIELDLEAQKEVESYKMYGKRDCYSETVWKESEVEEFLKGDFKNIKRHRIETLSKLLSAETAKLRGIKYTKDYKNIFDENLFVTKNFAHTVIDALPVFHKLQKNGEQILFVQDGDQFNAYFLSLKEALFFKNFLEKNKENKDYAKVWLALPDGELFVDNPHRPFPREDSKVERILIQANFFNGNVTHLDKESEDFEGWLEEKEYALKVHYLKRKVLRRKKEDIEALYRSGLLDLGAKGKGGGRYTLFGARKEKLANPELWISKLSEEKIRGISASLVRFLTEKEIPLLSRPLQIARLKSQQIQYVDPVQVKLLGEGQLQYLKTMGQVNAVASNLFPHLKSEQLGLLDDVNITLIDAELIPKVPKEHVKRLGDHQVPHLKITQVPHIKQSQAKFLATKDQINAIADKAFYKELEMEKLLWLNDDKFQTIDDPDLIKKIPNDHVKRLHKTQVKHIDRAQAKYLETKEQINAIVDKTFYEELESEKLGLFNDANLQSIDNPDLIKKIPDSHVKRVHSTQVHHLKKEQIKFLETEEQINAIDDKALYCELESKKLGLLKDDKLQAIDDPDLIKKIPDGHVKRVSKAQVQHLKKEQVKFLETEEQINELKLDLYGELASEKLGLLKTDKLQLIVDSEVIKKIPAEKVPELLIAQLGAIGKGQTKFLNTKEQINALKSALYEEFELEQWKLLEDDKIVALAEKALIQKVPAELIEKLPIDQVVHILKTQVSGLTDPDKIKKLTTQDQIEGLTEPQVVKASIDQVKSMNEEQCTWLIKLKETDPALNDLISKAETRLMQINQAKELERKKAERKAKSGGEGNSNAHNVTDPNNSDNGHLEAGYWSSTLARRANSWLNQKSDIWQVQHKNGWKKIYYAGNIFAPGKLAHMVSVAVNIATAVTEFFLALALIPLFVFGKGTAGLVLQLPQMKGEGKVRRFWHNWNYSAFGHLKNSLAYTGAAAVDAASFFVTPKLGFDLNNRYKKQLRIIA
jgi:hypothetical protein